MPSIRWRFARGVVFRVSKSQKYSIAIIGAGASGLLCAIHAAKRGKSVAIIDHNKTVGRKIAISGGGRCNFTNSNVSADNYISENPHFVKSALAGFTPADSMAMLDGHGIDYDEKGQGQLFLRGSSRDMLGMLTDECLSSGVKILAGQEIASISKGNHRVIARSASDAAISNSRDRHATTDVVARDDKHGSFSIETNVGTIEADSLVIATGGLSYETLGASNLGYKIAERFGIGVTPLRPALVPLTFSGSDRRTYSSISGVSFRGRASIKRRAFTDDILFTHKGLSGPAILQISSYWKEGQTISIDTLPDRDIGRTLIDGKSESGNMLIKNFMARYLPQRFTKIWCKKHGLDEKLSAYADKSLERVGSDMHDWKVVPACCEGYDTAEATRGGIDTSEISSKTMESKKVPGLHFIGEVLDVVGHLGGYNIHWAFASGHACGKNL